MEIVTGRSTAATRAGHRLRGDGRVLGDSGPHCRIGSNDRGAALPGGYLRGHGRACYGAAPNDEAGRTPDGSRRGALRGLLAQGERLGLGDSKDGKKSAPAAGGLVVDEVKAGEGATATKGKTVSVHYTGRLTDGTKFDSSYDCGQPIDFSLGWGVVIKGGIKGFEG